MEILSAASAALCSLSNALLPPAIGNDPLSIFAVPTGDCEDTGGPFNKREDARTNRGTARSSPNAALRQPACQVAVHGRMAKPQAKLVAQPRRDRAARVSICAPPMLVACSRVRGKGGQWRYAARGCRSLSQGQCQQCGVSAPEAPHHVFSVLRRSLEHDLCLRPEHSDSHLLT